jgi:hypothetical protein
VFVLKQVKWIISYTLEFYTSSVLRFYSWFYLMMTRAGRNMLQENELQQCDVWRYGNCCIIICLKVLNFSQRYEWGTVCSGMWHCVTSCSVCDVSTQWRLISRAIRSTEKLEGKRLRLKIRSDINLFLKKYVGRTVPCYRHWITICW